MKITKDNIDAFLEGLAIYGTGGGGSPIWGRQILEHDFEMGRTVKIIEPEDVPDDAWIASGGIMGSVKILEKKSPKEMVQGWDKHFELEDAFQLQAETIGHKIDYIVCCELGGLNTPIILSLGARTGVPVINGDGLGRASPETHMVSFIGHGVSLTPMTLVDAVGNGIVVRYGVDPTFADTLGRWVITRGGGLGANCHYPMQGKKLKEVVIPHTLTKALQLGETVLKARHDNIDPVAAIAKCVEGKHILSGTIQKLEEKEWEGFYFTRIELSGGAEMVIKNEAMALFIGNKPVTIFPDLILLLDPVTGQGLMSANLKLGDEIALVVTACHPRLRGSLDSKVGKEAMSPIRFGQPNLTYRPIEELLP